MEEFLLFSSRASQASGFHVLFEQLVHLGEGFLILLPVIHFLDGYRRAISSSSGVQSCRVNDIRKSRSLNRMHVWGQ